MVFTIVTIIFLPMSFIAAFFAINFEDWGDQLTIGYVSKYMFGIGLAISFVFVASAFLVHDISDAWRTILKGAKKYSRDLLHKTKTNPEKDRPPREGSTCAGQDEYHKPSTSGGVATSYRSAAEDMDWKKRELNGGPETYMRVSRDREQLERARLGLSPRFDPRKMSIGSGGIPRLSLDGRRGRFSGDLERGRDPSRSRVRWESAL